MTIETRNLRYAYRGAPVLNGVDLRIDPGITAVVGPNAAGKSTLLKCLCGILKPEGEVSIDGRGIGSYSARDLRHLVSYLPQDLGVRAALSVFETVLLGRAHELGWRVSPGDLECVDRTLEELGIADLGERKISELSGGQFQMVAIAQALARDPRILILDEPTSSLDMEHQFSISAWIRRLTDARGICTVMALHDLNAAARFADQVCVIKDGRTHRAGTPAAVLTEETIRSVYRVFARVSLDAEGRPLITPLKLAAEGGDGG